MSSLNERILATEARLRGHRPAMTDARRIDVARSLTGRLDATLERYGARAPHRDTARITLERAPRDGAQPAPPLVEGFARILERSRNRGLTRELLEAVDVATGRIDLSILHERILGKDEMVHTAFLIRGVQAARAVGRIVLRSQIGTPLGYGTGFMVSEHLLLTNEHVLETAQQAAAATIEFDFLEPIGGGASRPQIFRLQPSRFFLNSRDLDYALVAVESVNQAGERVADRGWHPLLPNSGKALIGERVNLIQHPSGGLQRFAIRDNQIIDVLPDHLHYKSDTMQGSSGSPVFNDEWVVCALHHSGVPARDANDRILLQDGRPWSGDDAEIPLIKWVANEGVRVSAITADVRARRAGLTADQDDLVADLLSQTYYGAGFQSRSRNTHFGRGAADAMRRSGPAAVALRSESETSDGVRVELTVRRGGALLDQHAFDVPETPGAIDAPARAPEPTVSEAYYDPVADGAAAAAYYGDFDPVAINDKDVAFDRLHALLESTHTRILGYREARHDHLYPRVDVHPDGRLRSIYSGDAFQVEEILRLEAAIEADRARMSESLALLESASPADRAALEAWYEARLAYNCEHVVPQSWFAKRNPMKADLHHLFTCEPGCNSFRSNIPYYDFANFDEAHFTALSERLVLETLHTLSADEAYRTDCGKREGNKFEPKAGKGAAARATLYFLVRYPGHADELPADRIATLISWHAQHPVSTWERHRNAEIARVQGNRNPFIDRPDWIDRIAVEKGRT